MAEFTKGDWEVGFNPSVTGPTTATERPFCGGLNWPYLTITVGEETIALVPAQATERIVGKHSQPLIGSDLANAHLIAAAPIGYELANAVLDDKPLTEITALACKFIAKAVWSRL